MFDQKILLFIIAILLICLIIFLVWNSRRDDDEDFKEKRKRRNKRSLNEEYKVNGKTFYVVLLVKKSTIDDLNSIIEEYSIKVVDKFIHKQFGFKSELNKGTVKKLRIDKRVCCIEKDRIIKATPLKRGKRSRGEQKVDWWVPRIGANYTSTISGNGYGDVDIDIYILDTGVDPKHKDLNVVGGVSFIPNERDYKDGNGHGTHVAGIAAARDNTSHTVGVAPGARIHAVKVLDRNGSGSFSSVISGINYVIGEKENYPDKPMIINMSLGAYVGTTEYNSIDLAIKEAVDSGIVVCVAAGNDADDASLYTPAHVDEAITVSASDSNDYFASFSNYGPKVDITSPGVNILSTYVKNRVATLSGTSMASPITAGTAALYLSKNPISTPLQVKEALLNAANNPSSYQDGTSLSNPFIRYVPQNTTNLSLFCGNF